MWSKICARIWKPRVIRSKIKKINLGGCQNWVLQKLTNLLSLEKLTPSTQLTSPQPNTKSTLWTKTEFSRKLAIVSDLCHVSILTNWKPDIMLKNTYHQTFTTQSLLRYSRTLWEESSSHKIKGSVALCSSKEYPKLLWLEASPTLNWDITLRNPTNLAVSKLPVSAQWDALKKK
jgi:hypothetical protein